METTFKLIKADKDISEKEGFGTMVISSFVILCIGAILIKIFQVHPFIAALVMLALIRFGRPVVRKLFSDYTKETDVIGELRFDINQITWGSGHSDQILNCADLASIKLRFNYVQGLQYASKDIIHNGLALLSIQTKSSQTVSIKFLIEKKEQLDELKPIWKEYYRAGIKIKESMGKYDIKTILLEPDNKSYEELQALKKELNVDSFY